MPTDWIYHADGVNTAVEAQHDLDGQLMRVRVELDTFKHRGWTEDEEDIRAAGKNPENMHYDEETDAFEEYADGSHATMAFDVDADVANLSSVTPEDGEAFEPRHMALLPAAARVLKQLDDIRLVATADLLMETFTDAEEVQIDALDA